MNFRKMIILALVNMGSPYATSDALIRSHFPVVYKYDISTRRTRQNSSGRIESSPFFASAELRITRFVARTKWKPVNQPNPTPN